MDLGSGAENSDGTSGLHLRSHVNATSGSDGPPLSAAGPLHSVRSTVRVPIRAGGVFPNPASLANYLLPQSGGPGNVTARSSAATTTSSISSVAASATQATREMVSLLRRSSESAATATTTTTASNDAAGNAVSDGNHTIVDLDGLFQNLSEEAHNVNAGSTGAQAPPQTHQPPSAQQQLPGGSAAQEESGSNEGNIMAAISNLLQMNPELRCVLVYGQKYIPFLLIILIKLLFDHGAGLLIGGCLFVTFYHANSVVKQQVTRNERRSSLGLLTVVVNLSACIAFIYFVYGEEKIYYSAIFLPPPTLHSILDLLWIVVVNDFILKFVAIIIKVAVVFVPTQLVLHRRRGRYFLFIERFSQLHRELAPIQPWLTYLLDYEKIPGKVIGVILVAGYMVLKGKSLLKSALDLKSAFVILFQPTTFGRVPSGDQIKAAGEQCPICYDSYSLPTLLRCKHIFCEDCLSLWFDRERTCPLCRAQVTENPEWRDGSTSLAIQFA